MTDRSRPGSRRRVALQRDRRINPMVMLSIGVPLLTVAALASVSPSPTEDPGRAPGTAPLSSSVVVCPPARGDVDDVRVALANTSQSGTIRVAGAPDVTISGGALSTVGRSSYVVLRAEGDLASGLVASRTGETAAVACTPPDSDVWFTGVGAGPEHSSVLHLVNPDAGPALADVTVHGPGGVREVAGLRGLAVPARGEIELDLSRVAPARNDLTIRIQVSRGRLASSVMDRIDELGSASRAVSWLPANDAPSRDPLLLGVARGGGDRTLVVTNDGSDETRVNVLAVTAESEFAPAGVEPVNVPPGATVTVSLSDLLRSDVVDGLVGLRLESREPVSAQLRTRTGSDLTHAVAAPLLSATAAGVVAAGPKRLVLAGADAVTEVTVVQRDAGGRELEPVRVTMRPGRGRRLGLDPRARWVEVQMDGGRVAAALEAGAGGVRPLFELVTESLVPDVRPALY
ncbi:DUF5719 family protein [Nocardioides gilvus]|uniref:DUF5719 family protein n=1 Tax=Nocardioides gilvus TaxID=1735589 RepID=UPI0013A5B379|nr:DUF5719 family protein [Nocardioides gilvus]